MRRHSVREYPVVISELVQSEGLHCILTKEGPVYFFHEYEHPIDDEKAKLLVENAELNIERVFPEEREEFREHIEKLKHRLGLAPNV